MILLLKQQTEMLSRVLQQQQSVCTPLDQMQQQQSVCTPLDQMQQQQSVGIPLDQMQQQQSVGIPLDQMQQQPESIHLCNPLPLGAPLPLLGTLLQPQQPFQQPRPVMSFPLYQMQQQPSQQPHRPPVSSSIILRARCDGDGNADDRVSGE